jgi:UDP-N-acetylmuramate dehydrogenase
MKLMTITKEANLGHYSTMGLGGTAAYKTEVTSREDVVKAYEWAQQSKLPVIMIGGGSNIIWSDEGFSGLVIINKIPGYDVYQEDDVNFYLTIGAGEPWDSVVERSVAAGLSGIEALSLVPGSAGGTPIQNVGAYGQEISHTLTMVEVFDTQNSTFASVAAADCGFSYRDSRFKSQERGRYFIISITLHLTKTNPQPPFYPSVQAYFDQKGIVEPKPSDLREAVISIRTAKLPDPAVVKNTGSFFGNPIISKEQFDSLSQQFPDLPNWPLSDGTIKLSAAWLIEQTGFKDFHDSETGMSTWPTQPLVLINEKAKKTADLVTFRDKIVSTVQTKFGIILVQEPEMLP